jgi:hypothetical protein
MFTRQVPASTILLHGQFMARREMPSEASGRASRILGKPHNRDEPIAGSGRQVSNIVAAYVRRNQIASDQLPTLISTVHHALVSLGKPVPEIGDERWP